MSSTIAGLIFLGVLISVGVLLVVFVATNDDNKETGLPPRCRWFGHTPIKKESFGGVWGPFPYCTRCGTPYPEGGPKKWTRS